MIARSGQAETSRQTTPDPQIPMDHASRYAEPNPSRGFLPRGLSDTCRPSSWQTPSHGRRPTTLNNKRHCVIGWLWGENYSSSGGIRALSSKDLKITWEMSGEAFT